MGVNAAIHIHSAECVSFDGICIVREILVEILACHIITSVALIRKQFSSQNEENVVQI